MLTGRADDDTETRYRDNTRTVTKNVLSVDNGQDVFRC